MAAATATPKNMSYEFTLDDDELDDEKSSTDQGTMCNFYKLNLPASASILSKQIAKSQAKRAKKEDRHRRRVDLSTVREQDETRGSNSEEHASPRPVTGLAHEEVASLPPSAPASQYGGRSRIDSAPLDVKLQRQASLPEEQRKAEPMDEEEAELLAMLLSGIERNERKMMLNGNGNQPIQTTSYSQPIPQIPPSPGLPRLPPTAKVSEWLLERSSSPDNLSVVSSVLLEDSGYVLNYQNSENEEDEDIFFDAQEEKVEKDDVVNCVEHEMQGLSLNRNMSAMTQSLVRVEEEITTTDGGHDMMNGRSGRSTSVSPRPSNEQFLRNTNGSATFNVKHSSTLARLQKLTPPVANGNLNNTTSTTTPLSSRTTRSVLRVHNVNSMPRPVVQTVTPMSKSSVLTNQTNRRAVSGVRMPEPTHTPVSTTTPNHKTSPPVVTINPSTPSRPASVASSIGTRSGANVNMTSTTASNIEGLQDLIQMQEEALRRAALESQTTERKMSWHSDQDPNRHSTSTHSSLGSLCSSKSIDGANALNKLGTPASRIPTPRSRLPTPRGSNLPKRVSIGVQTDIPWPPPCVLRHRSLSVPALQTDQFISRTPPTNAFESKIVKPNLPAPGARSTRRMARSLLITPSISYDSASLASFLLVPTPHRK
uniref:Flocculation protein FLO11 n=1 Tax=Caenorhabditis tropicalis TaxID=1561998 RepID=A0A1I7UJX3_9PELO